MKRNTGKITSVREVAESECCYIYFFIIENNSISSWKIIVKILLGL